MKLTAPVNTPRLLRFALCIVPALAFAPYRFVGTVPRWSGSEQLRQRQVDNYWLYFSEARHRSPLDSGDRLFLSTSSGDEDRTGDKARFMAEMPPPVVGTAHVDVNSISSPALVSFEQGSRPSAESSMVVDSSINRVKKETNLFATAHSMVCLSTLIYKFSALRKDSDLQRLLEPPITVGQTMEVILNHIDRLFAICSKDEAMLVLQAMQSLKREGSSVRRSEWIEFQDANSEKECVYSILLNHEFKRCTVVFRGSNNNKDFVQDGKIPMTRRDNPVKELRGQFGDIFLHQGFEQYLFQRGNKVFQILNTITPYLKEGYSLFCTGHSLGGALATILGFYAAADNKSSLIGNSKCPVQIYTFGSPRVGDKFFHDAFKHLELQNKIRHARFHNRMDLVARAPSHAPPTLRRYAHVGMDIVLRSDMEPSMKYDPTIQEEDDALKAVLKSEAFRSADLPRLRAPETVTGVVGRLIYHDPETYMKRIVDAKKSGDAVSLEGIYQKLMSGKR